MDGQCTVAWLGMAAVGCLDGLRVEAVGPAPDAAVMDVLEELTGVDGWALEGQGCAHRVGAFAFLLVQEEYDGVPDLDAQAGASPATGEAAHSDG